MYSIRIESGGDRTANYVPVADKLSNVDHQNPELQVIVQCVAVAVSAFFNHEAYNVQFLVCLLDFLGPVVDRAYRELLLGRSNTTASQALVPPKVQVRVS